MRFFNMVVAQNQLVVALLTMVVEVKAKEAKTPKIIANLASTLPIANGCLTRVQVLFMKE